MSDSIFAIIQFFEVLMILTQRRGTLNKRNKTDSDCLETEIY